MRNWSSQVSVSVTWVCKNTTDKIIQWNDQWLYKRVHLRLEINDLQIDTGSVKMRFHQQAIFLVLCLAVVGDIGSFFNSMWTGSELVSHNAGLLIPGADAVWGAVARAAARAISRSLSKSKKKGGAEHTKGKRPSTKGKHEKGQSRKQRDQERASDKKQKGGKDGSKKSRKGNKG